MKADLFQSCGHGCIFLICSHFECSTFTAWFFRIWNNQTYISSTSFLVMLPKVHSTWLCSPGCLALVEALPLVEWLPLWLSGSWRSFLYSSSVYSCHLSLISSASVRSIPFLSFIKPIFEWNVPLVSLIFLKRSLVFPILIFLYFFALISEDFLISPCYSLELCIQMGISFLFSFAFCFYNSRF